MKLEGNEIISTDDCDIFCSYGDCWSSQTENGIKHRINAGDKANDAKGKTVASIFENKFCIPLDFEILETGIPLYQYGLGSPLTHELTFAGYSDVIKSANTDTSYTITNISLEFDTVTNASLASQIRNLKLSINLSSVNFSFSLPSLSTYLSTAMSTEKLM